MIIFTSKLYAIQNDLREVETVMLNSAVTEPVQDAVIKLSKAVSELIDFLDSKFPNLSEESK